MFDGVLLLGCKDKMKCSGYDVWMLYNIWIYGNIVSKTLAITTTNADWSIWGTWGECSRDCGGGVANMTRTCLGDSDTCNGHVIRFRVCNKQGCGTNNESLRQLQCRSYNDVSINENYFHWQPHYSSVEPCVLYCRTLETDFILKMHTTVWNGTTCGKYGRGVCISGLCKKTGCDGIVSSKMEADVCGVCGGDGSSCDTSRGIVLANQQRDEGNRDEIKESNKPGTCAGRRHCNIRWHVFKWGLCSRTCGSGYRYRRVVCLKRNKDGQWKRTNDRKCTDVKPDIQSTCNMGDCPEWLTGPWSQCSAACGLGQQKRKVVCKTASVATCSRQHKPAIVQACKSGRSCLEEGKSFQQDDSSASKHDFFDDNRLMALLLAPKFEIGDWGSCSVTCGLGYRLREITCVRGEQVIPLGKCEGTQPHPKKQCHAGVCPSVQHGGESAYAWSSDGYATCSKTCGRGIQESRLKCLNSANNRTVIDMLCTGLRKPQLAVRYCNVISCPPRWNVGVYSECSSPCGGGRQSRDVKCEQTTSNGGVHDVTSYRCPDPIPLSERSCNLQFCQAEWRTGDWTECSVTCGMGMESRPAFCVKDVKVGVKINVSTSECIGPRPASARQCHFGDCYKLEQLPEIKEHKGTFIQIKRSKRVALFVGETAVLLPNQAVKIRCPVRNFHKKLLFWTKDRRLIPLVGRVRVSSNGALRITRANPNTDMGVFYCSAGMLQARVNITFQTKKEAKVRAKNILNTIFSENLNDSFINRPQRDGLLKMKGNAFFHINSIDENNYDYSSFTTTNWTKCSSNCGWGIQSRIVTCNHVTERFIRLLPESECEKKGLKRPSSTQKCIMQKECPKWITGQWTKCSTERCHSKGFGLQKRDASCQYDNGTHAQLHLCNETFKPETEKQCNKPECIAVWQTSRWSECTPQCGIKGRKLRTLRCVWVPTKLSARDNCATIPRPAVSKRCKPSPCNIDMCTDKSQHCSLARHLRMCRYSKFRRRCCNTCRSANI